MVIVSVPVRAGTPSSVTRMLIGKVPGDVGVQVKRPVSGWISAPEGIFLNFLCVFALYFYWCNS